MSTLTARAGWLSLIAVALGALMPALATTILAVANGAITTDLKIGLGDLVEAEHPFITD